MRAGELMFVVRELELREPGWMSTRLGRSQLRVGRCRLEWESGLVHAAADGCSPRSAIGSSRCGTRAKVGLVGMTSSREFLSRSDEEGFDQPVAIVGGKGAGSIGPSLRCLRSFAECGVSSRARS